MRDLSAPAQARAIVDSLLVGPGRAEDATLLTSELVTNAVRHGSDGTVHLRVRLDGSKLRVEVSHEGRFRAHAGNGGRGLRIIGALATRWGIQGEPPRITSWFEL